LRATYFSEIAESPDLLDKILAGKFKIAVYGLGHVGAPLASVWLRLGAHVIGVDKSPRVIENAKDGKTHIPEPNVNEAFSKGLSEKRFTIMDDLVQASRLSHFKMICVPVLAADGSADLTAVKEVARAIGKGLKRKDMVALNPSVPPGTTEGVVLPILEKESGLKAERDFYLLYNPERIYEGRAIEDIEERYPAIIAGVGSKSLEEGKRLYSLIFKKGVMMMTNFKTAETEKLLEGVYRDINIAVANEMAQFCEKMGVDFWEAREGANSQPFCHIHKPGVGVGGACIPVYPQFIIDTAEKAGIECRITKLGRITNDSMPAYCVQQAVKLLEESKATAKKTNTKSTGNRTVTLLGLAFRGDVSDTRLSPTYKVIDELKKLGVKRIRVHDPLVKSDPILLNYEGVFLTSDLQDAVKDTDLIMLVTDHRQYTKITQKTFGSKIPVYDGRGLLDPDNFKGSPLATIGKPYTSL
jgi:nucleotide sugar dehydrogenase